MSDAVLAIIVASIGAVGVIGAATIPAVLTHRRIGKPNGRGNVVEMLEKLLDGQETQDQRLTSAEGRLADVEARVAHVEASGR